MAFAFQQPDVLVVPDHDVQVAQFRNFFEEPHVAGVKPVEAAGDDHLLYSDRGLPVSAVRASADSRTELGITR